MVENIELVNEIVVTNEDFSQIYNFFANADSEKILSLFMEKNGGMCRIKGAFKDISKGVYIANDKHIIFSSRKIYNQLIYCKTNNFGYCIIHNHLIGNEPSKSDYDTMEKICDVAIEIGVKNIIFGIYDMNAKEIRFLLYNCLAEKEERQYYEQRIKKE
ncbi:MAG: hypothetical protein E7309_09830 [Butyrivibrio sp.]|jgi:hypothetical protein|nr:hypothetical protein [Butyrivibrio sp.]